MRARAALAVVAASVLIPAASASAQEELDAGEIDTSGYPTLEVIVSTPGGTAEPTDFEVTEPGGIAVLTVVPFAAGGLDVVLAIDTSGSMTGEPLASARAAAQEFITVLPTQARVAVIGFGPTPTVAVPLTADRAAVGAAIDGLTAGGETGLYDAVVAAALVLQAGSEARSALVVLSDGGDTVSATSLDQAAAISAARFDVVHAISLVTGEQDIAALDRIVSGGGSVVEARDPVALSSVYADVADRIVNQYALRWETTLVEDLEVEITYYDGTTTYTASRAVDIDEAIVEPPPVSTPTADVVTEVPDPEPVGSTPPVVDNPGTLGDGILLLGLLFVAVALFVAGLVLFGPRTRTRHLAAEFRQRVPRGRELTGAGKRLVKAVESLLRRDPERHSGLALRLERAGLDWTPAEFGALVVAGAAVLALVGFGVGRFIGLILLPLIGVFASLAVVDSRAAKRSRLFTAQLDGTLQLIAGSLRSGFGIMHALGTVADEAEWPTSEEFTRILGEVHLGRDLGAALEASARRIDSEDYGWVVQAIEISREVGGNLAEVLDNVSGTIRQRNTLRRMVRSLSAEGRVSAVILFSLPFGMLAWMKVSNPEYVDLLFSRGGGQIALVVGVVLMVLGGLWMRKIVRVRF